MQDDRWDASCTRRGFVQRFRVICHALNMSMVYGQMEGVICTIPLFGKRKVCARARWRYAEFSIEFDARYRATVLRAVRAECGHYYVLQTERDAGL